MRTKVFQKNIANILCNNSFSIANTDPGREIDILCILQNSIRLANLSNPILFETMLSNIVSQLASRDSILS